MVLLFVGYPLLPPIHRMSDGGRVRRSIRSRLRRDQCRRQMLQESPVALNYLLVCREGVCELAFSFSEQTALLNFRNPITMTAYFPMNLLLTGVASQFSIVGACRIMTDL